MNRQTQSGAQDVTRRCQSEHHVLAPIRRSMVKPIVGCLGVAFATLACSTQVDEPSAGASGLHALDAQSTSTKEGTSPFVRSGAERKASPRLIGLIGSEVDTLLLSVSVADERVAKLQRAGIMERYAVVSRLAESALSALESASAGGEGSTLTRDAVERLSRIAGQIPVLVRRIKQELRAGGQHSSEYAEVVRGLEAVKLSAKSLGVSLVEAREALRMDPRSRLSADEQASVQTLSGPIAGSWYLLDEGHVDVIDVAYEDEELGLSIHDESVEPDVERDPATTILLVKSSAKVQVPDARFAFLGPVGSNAWILPEGQPEAEAAGLLWPGIATHEVDHGVFVADSVDIRCLNVLGPNGFSLFESPQDEFSNPNVLVDSENGLPDTLAVPAGVHRHANWAFESPGVYLVRIQARGRLAEVPGNPWVRSQDAVLKFVVQP